MNRFMEESFKYILKVMYRNKCRRRESYGFEIS